MVAIERHGSRSASAIFQALLLLGVYGFALSLLVGRGTYKPSLYVCALGVIGVLAARRFRMRLERPVWAMLGFGLVFLVQGWAVADRPIAGDFHWALGWAMVAATAVNLLPARMGLWTDHRAAVSALLILFVAAQAVAYRFEIKEAGLFSNIHYMALYSVITLPLLFYLAVEAESALRWVFILALAGDFLLLMKTHSRPGYLALLASTLVTVPFLGPRIRVWVLAVIIIIPAALYFSGLFGFAARIDDLIEHFSEEERPKIWRETWGLLMKGDGLERWLGHGLGQFYEDYLVIPKEHWWKDYYASPHNYILELLYSHGWLGLVLFLLAYGLFYAHLANSISASHDKARKRLGVALISVATAQLAIGFLTLPFFSRHNIYPLSLIIGFGLRYISEARRHD